MTDIILEARRVLQEEAEGINNLQNLINNNFIQAVELIRNTKGKVVVIGCGKSGLVGQKIAATMASIGTPAISIHPTESAHGDLGVISKDDLVIGISHSGNTKELIDLIPALKRMGIKLIGMTSNLDSELVQYSDIVLDIGVKKEACSLNLAPTTSTTVTLALGDALAVVLSKVKNFTKEDFSLFHPAGSLGKRLLLTVGDIIKKHNNPPLISVNQTIKEALFEMTDKRLGAVCITDSNQKLLGVFTDGDLRRKMDVFGPEIFSMTIKNLMTIAPKTIKPEVLAVSALNMMETNKVNCLVVTDFDNKVLGLVHVQDLIERGLH